MKHPKYLFSTILRVWSLYCTWIRPKNLCPQASFSVNFRPQIAVKIECNDCCFQVWHWFFPLKTIFNMNICVNVVLLKPSSNEKKSCMGIDEGWQARVFIRVFLTLMSWSNQNKSCMRVEKGEFLIWKFSQLSCPCQTRTRVAWELRKESFYESFLNSHVLVKREQEKQQQGLYRT